MTKTPRLTCKKSLKPSKSANSPEDKYRNPAIQSPLPLRRGDFLLTLIQIFDQGDYIVVICELYFRSEKRSAIRTFYSATPYTRLAYFGTQC